MKNILLIGSGAREHAIAKAVTRSRQSVNLYVLAPTINPGIQELSVFYKQTDINDTRKILDFIGKAKIDAAIIGPEAPLAAGVADALSRAGIYCFGPNKQLAQLESSKSFTRNLLREYKIDISPVYHVCANLTDAKAWLRGIDGEFVIKPDGLTGGKGVRVQGDHFFTKAEGMDIITELMEAGERVVIEQKLVGQEFSLMSICDGTHLLHLPVVQDHKRAYEDDKGPNTGGMGSYSDVNFRLPFLSEADVRAAQVANKRVAAALSEKYGKPYQGVLYGGFMATATGVKLIEYNARFGDPEAMNVLSLLQNDFLEVIEAVISGNLDTIKPVFKPLASVCKYVVPEGYPEHPVKDKLIDLSDVDKTKVDIFYAAVDDRSNGLRMTGSRAVALVACSKDIYEAERIVETEIRKIKGPVFHRKDIGTKGSIEKKISFMEDIRINQ